MWKLLFKRYFKKLNLLQKVEIYLLVIIFYGSIIWFFDDIFTELFKTKQNDKSIKAFQKDIYNIRQKVTLKSNIEFLNFIESNMIKYNIINKVINLKDNYINIKMQGKFIDIINMLNVISLHTSIKMFSFSKNDISNSVICDIEVKSKYFFNQYKEYKKLQNVPNPFFKDTINDMKKSTKFKIGAIVSDEVLIFGDWYKVGDSINDYKILDIDKNFIKIINIKNNTKKEIFIDENR